VALEDSGSMLERDSTGEKRGQNWSVAPNSHCEICMSWLKLRYDLAVYII